MYTQVVDLYKNVCEGQWAHLATTGIRSYEQEALSAFRVGVAPAFIGKERITTLNGSNRFSRTCEFCRFMYGGSHVDDVFHCMFLYVLYSHPNDCS